MHKPCSDGGFPLSRLAHERSPYRRLWFGSVGEKIEHKPVEARRALVHNVVATVRHDLETGAGDCPVQGAAHRERDDDIASTADHQRGGGDTARQQRPHIVP